MLELVRRLERDDTVKVEAALSLTWEARQRSRQLVRLDDGREAALLLPRGVGLKHGDLLQAASGQLVRVAALAEDLSLALCADPVGLARACYHLGNRHVPVQIQPGRLLYQRDHVLDEMLRGLGLEPEAVRAPFEPESGAYHGHQHAGHGGHGESGA